MRLHPNSGGHTREGDKPPWGTAHAAESPAEEGDVHKRRRVRSYTDPEGSREGHGRGPRSGRAEAGSLPWAVHGAEANDSHLLSGLHSTRAAEAGCAHGTRHDNHRGEGYIHEVGRVGCSRSQAGKGDGESASGRGHLWAHQAESAGILANRIERAGGRADGHTLATQVTRVFLNSRPSSFSTAVLRSAAVSNSTKLEHVSTGGLAMTCRRSIPFAAAAAVGLGVDDIKAGLPGEVFQILEPESL